MNRMLKCLSTPTVSSWYHYPSFLSNFAPLLDEAFSSNVNRPFHYYVDERKQVGRSASRLLCNNQQHRRRLDVRKAQTTSCYPLDTRPVIVLPNDFRCYTVEQSNPIREQVSRNDDYVEVLFSAAGKEVDKYPEGKPNWEKLQHICIRLADTWPKFFVMRMDYTIFRYDVILEDRIYGRSLRGIENYRWYLGIVAAAGRIIYPQIEMHVMNITPFIEDATVRMRWRIYYMNIFDFAVMIATLNKFTPEYLKTKGRIMDGYSIYYADADGAVYRHVIDQVIPDDEKRLGKGRLTVAQRLLALVGGSTSPKQAPSTH